MPVFRWGCPGSMYLVDTFPLDRTIKVLEQYIRKVGRVGIHLKLNLSSGIISVSIFTKCSNSNMIFCAIFGITVVINCYGIDGRIICFWIMYCTYVTTSIQHVHFSSTLTYALLYSTNRHKNDPICRPHERFESHHDRNCRYMLYMLF